MASAEVLYRAIGRKIRAARERSARKLSQAKLAKQLGISRASIVNIEAGRQHAPLHLLSQIAEALDTELVLLIPRTGELQDDGRIKLNDTMRKQIIHEARGNIDVEKSLTRIVGRLLTTIDPDKKRGPE